MGLRRPAHDGDGGELSRWLVVVAVVVLLSGAQTRQA